MASATIHLHDDDGDPRGDALAIYNGESFIMLTIGSGLALILPGHDHVAITSARAIARALTHTADQLEARLNADVAVSA